MSTFNPANEGSSVMDLDRLYLVAQKQHRAVSDPPGYLRERMNSLQAQGQTARNIYSEAYNLYRTQQFSVDDCKSKAEARTKLMMNVLLAEWNQEWPASAAELAASLVSKRANVNHA
jgi:hypothetical protein